MHLLFSMSPSVYEPFSPVVEMLLWEVVSVLSPLLKDLELTLVLNACVSLLTRSIRGELPSALKTSPFL